MTKAQTYFAKMLGTEAFELVEPYGSLWVPRGRTIYVRHLRGNIGALRYLEGLNFIEHVGDAGGRGIIQVRLKPEKA